MVGIQALFDNADKTVTMNQAFQVSQKPHLSFLPMLFLMIYTVERAEYHGEFHEYL